MRSDSCSWILERPGHVFSLISGHVDDFLFDGRDACDVWADLRQKIQNRVNWQEWERLVCPVQGENLSETGWIVYHVPTTLCQ